MEWLKACQRVLKPTGTLWVSGTQHVIFNVGFAMQKLGFKLLNTVTWYKPNASPNLSCRYFTHSTELLIWASPRQTKTLQHTFNYARMKAENGGKQMRDVWNLPRTGEEELTADGAGRMWTSDRSAARGEGVRQPSDAEAGGAAWSASSRRARRRTRRCWIPSTAAAPRAWRR